MHALDGRGRVASMAMRKCVIVIGKRGGAWRRVDARRVVVRHTRAFVARAYLNCFNERPRAKGNVYIGSVSHGSSPEPFDSFDSFDRSIEFVRIRLGFRPTSQILRTLDQGGVDNL